MKNKSILVFISICAAFLTLYGIGRSRVDASRTDYAYRLHAAALPVPAEMIKALAGEFKGMAANYLLLEAMSFIGSRQASKATSADWDAVTRLLEQSSNLDPYFKSTYRLAQSNLPWEAHRYDETLNILERSRRHRPWDWEPGFYIGFDYYFFLKDNLTASKKLMEAYKVPDAPVLIATLASRLASESGQMEAAIEFLIAMYERTDDEPRKQALKQRIMALKGVVVLQSAVDRFRVQFGRMPHTLDELSEKSIIPALPVNPYGKPYSIKEDGRVEF